MKKNIKFASFLAIFLLINLIFIDFVSAETYNNYSNDVLSCGGGILNSIPSILPKLTSTVYIIIQIAVPVVLVILGMIDLMKGIMASKEDEIKKGQSMLIKRAIAAVLVFFVFAIVKLVISFASDQNTENIIDCAECFISGECDETLGDKFNSAGDSVGNAAEDILNKIEE